MKQIAGRRVDWEIPSIWSCRIQKKTCGNKPSWCFFITHLKNMRKSNWIMKPQGSGWNKKIETTTQKHAGNGKESHPKSRTNPLIFWTNKWGHYYLSGQIIIFHQPRFPWNKGISLTKPPFRVRSCEVAIIWPDLFDTQILKLFVSFNSSEIRKKLHPKNLSEIDHGRNKTQQTLLLRGSGYLVTGYM